MYDTVFLLGMGSYSYPCCHCRVFYRGSVMQVECGGEMMKWFSIDTELCDMPGGWRLKVQARVEERYGTYTVFQLVSTKPEQPTQEQVNATYKVAMQRIEQKRLQAEQWEVE